MTRRLIALLGCYGCFCFLQRRAASQLHSKLRGGTKMVNRLKQTHRRDILLGDSQSYLILYTTSFVSAYCLSTLLIIIKHITMHFYLQIYIVKLASIKLR